VLIDYYVTSSSRFSDPGFLSRTSARLRTDIGGWLDEADNDTVGDPVVTVGAVYSPGE
jgi:hypothetical protein